MLRPTSLPLSGFHVVLILLRATAEQPLNSSLFPCAGKRVRGTRFSCSESARQSVVEHHLKGQISEISPDSCRFTAIPPRHSINLFRLTGIFIIGQAQPAPRASKHTHALMCTWPPIMCICLSAEVIHFGKFTQITSCNIMLPAGG